MLQSAMFKWIIAAVGVGTLSIAALSQMPPAQEERPSGRSGPHWIIGPDPGPWCCRFYQDRGSSTPRQSRPESAFTILVEPYSDVILANGDRIDIFLTREVGGKLLNQVILEDVLALAADVEYAPNSRSADLNRTITVSVDGRSAQVLALARQVGSLSIAKLVDPDARPNVDVEGSNPIEPVIRTRRNR